MEQNLAKTYNPKEFEDVELLQKYLYDFKNYYKGNYPSKGFLVLNHNDVFRFNILYRNYNQKIFLIDHEYFGLNLPGYDISYYLTEYFFSYEPEYKCELNKVNFEQLFVIFEKFIFKFINDNKSLENEVGGKQFLEIIKTRKYFIQLMNIINLYLYIWALGNIDFEVYDKDHKKEVFLLQAVDRIKFYLLGMNKIENLNN